MARRGLSSEFIPLPLRACSYTTARMDYPIFDPLDAAKLSPEKSLLTLVFPLV